MTTRHVNAQQTHISGKALPLFDRGPAVTMQGLGLLPAPMTKTGFQQGLSDCGMSHYDNSRVFGLFAWRIGRTRLSRREGQPF